MSIREQLEGWFHTFFCPENENQSGTAIVHKGDNLWNIAKGSGDNLSELEIQTRVNQIVHANPQRQWDDERTIYEGEQLNLPRDWTKEDKKDDC
jgi:nucleoid-associated protein YgaU